MRTFLSSLICLVLMQSAVFAADEEISAKVNRNDVPLNGTVLLDLTISNAKVEAPDLQIPDFDVAFTGQSTSVQVFNMHMSSSTNYQYQLSPLREGTFQIPPIVVRTNNGQLSTEPITITVGPAQAVVSPSGNAPRLRTGSGDVVNIEDILSLTMHLDRPQITVGETVKLKIQLLSKQVEVLLDSVTQLEQEGLAFTTIKGNQSRSAMVAGEPTFIYDLETTVSAIKPGDYTLGPVTLSCEIPVPDRSDPFGGNSPFGSVFSRAFSRRIPVKVQSDQVTLKVAPLPAENRPPSFKGAVGIFNMQVRANPRSVQVGEPITVTIDINGEGNFNAISAPSISTQGPFKIYDAKLMSAPEEGETRGTKRFEVVMIPTSVSAKLLPPIEFSYYDPSKKDYVTQREEAITIQVSPADATAGMQESTPLAAPAPNVEVAQDGQHQIVSIQSKLGPKPKAAYWQQGRSWWLLCIAPFFILIAGEGFRRRHQYALENPAVRRAARARARAKQALRASTGAKEPHAQIARALQQYVADVVDLKPEGLTGREMQSALQHRSVSAQTLHALQRVLDACDAARFSSAAGGAQAREAVKEAESVVDQIERERR